MELLEELVRRLAAKNVETVIYLIGGVAAGSYYPAGINRQMSDDIDATFSAADIVLDEARAMAGEHGLRPGWFNDKAKGFIPPVQEPQGEIVISKGTVRVEIAPARFVLAMKLFASRVGRDDGDIAVLIRHCHITSVAEAEDLVAEVYLGEEEISTKGKVIVEAALGEYELAKSEPPTVLPAVIE